MANPLGFSGFLVISEFRVLITVMLNSQTWRISLCTFQLSKTWDLVVPCHIIVRYASSLSGRAKCFQFLVQSLYGQSHHIEVRAFDACDSYKSYPLLYAV